MDYGFLRNKAGDIRKDIIDMTFHAGGFGAHLGGSLSLAEIMSVLYFSVLNFDAKNMDKEDRDRLILSKGHGAVALYAAFKEAGIISKDEMDSFRHGESWLTAHPVMDIKKGIEFSSGSLGQGLGLGIGTALSLKMKKNAAHVYVILGDGECNEGAVWEGVMYAPQLALDNITVIVDKNGLQCDDRTTEIVSMENMAESWKSFGWDVDVIDGHDVEQIDAALSTKHDRPFVIIANTVKGRGVSFAENNPLWHMGRLTKEQYEQAISEQEKKCD